MLHSVRRAGMISVLLVVLTVGVVPGHSATVADQVCEACGTSFEYAAERHDATVSVERSTATIQIHENGSATWVVRNTLEDSGERFRENATLRAAIGESAFAEGTVQRSRVSDGVVTHRYYHADFARRTPGGTLYSGWFTSSYGTEDRGALGADSVTVVAPDGKRFDRTVPGANVTDDGSRMTLTSMDGESLLVLVPRDTALEPMYATLAVVFAAGPVLLLNVGVFVVTPSLLGAGLVWLVSYELTARETLPEQFGPNGPGLSVFGGGLTVLALAVGLLGSAGPTTVWGGGVGVALVALGGVLPRLAERDTVSYRVMLGLAVCGLGLVGVVGFGLTALTGAVASGTDRLLGLLFLCPLFALLPAGFAFGRGRRRLAALTVGAGVGLPPLSVLSLTVVPLLDTVPFGALLGIVFILVVTVEFVVGAPLLVAGIVLGRTGERGRTGSPGTGDRTG